MIAQIIIITQAIIANLVNYLDIKNCYLMIFFYLLQHIIAKNCSLDQPERNE